VQALSLQSLTACPTEALLVQYADYTVTSATRARIESHLVACENCDLAAAMLCASHASAVHLTTRDDELLAFVSRTRMARALSPGQCLGRFQLLRRVGIGAMGVVFAAHDPELDRDVALKVLLESGESKERERERLIREARSMAKLTHPHVVAVYEIGVAQQHVFLAMELVTGTTLKEWLEGRPDHRAILRLFAQTAHAIETGHRAGIVHRDLKPQNILVTREGLPKVTDFGLADAAVGASGLCLVGTPAYMSLEALAGGIAGPASDQFALAVCLHEALAGRRPYVASSLEGLRMALRQRPAIDRSIGQPLRGILERALDPNPALRYPTMSTFAEALAKAERPSRSRLYAGFGAAIAVAAGAATLLQFATQAGQHALLRPERRTPAELEHRRASSTSAPTPSSVAVKPLVNGARARLAKTAAGVEKVAALEPKMEPESLAFSSAVPAPSAPWPYQPVAAASGPATAHPTDWLRSRR
jgi:eukaryotic-like serine/threonine-protein kinase